MKFVSSHYEKLILGITSLILILVACLSYFSSPVQEKKESFLNFASFAVDSFGGDEVLEMLKDSQLLPGNIVKLYRSDEEKNEMRQNKDCLKIFRNKVIGSSLLNEKQLNDIDDKVLELIDNAVKFAREGAEPNLEDLTKDVYLSY